MGMENGGYVTRGVAFFNLFDWNKKSRRKLSTNGVASQEETKHQVRKDRVLPEIELRPNDSVDDVDGRGGESASPTRDGNSGLSVAGDDSSTAVKAPGVVARLMGLDFLPKSGTVESSCTPSVEPEDVCCRKESLDREFSGRISGESSGNELCSCRPSGLKGQKVANGPVERFQTETLQPWKKSVKSPLPVSHQKLLPPVKKSNFVSSGNAVAAAKILDASRQGNSSSSCPPKASSYPSLRVCDKSECSAASARQSRSLRSSLVCSNVMEPKLRGSSACNSSNSGGAKGKGKAASLFPQNGGNIEVKLGSSVGQNGIVSDQPHKRSNSQKKVDRKDSSANSSIVLKQNNQKQNTLGNRDMLPGKFGGSRHLHEQSLSRSRKGASVKSNPVNKLPDASVTRSAKECPVVGGLVKGKPASKIGTYTRQEKVRDRVKISRNMQLTESTSVNKKEKRIQHVVIADHKQKPDEDGRRDIADVVSFTFTSPVLISASADVSPARRVEKEEGGSSSSLDGLWKGNITDTKDTVNSTVDIEKMNGDDLGRLLEQKLRALTSELESSQDSFVKTEIGTRSTSQDSLIAPRTKAWVTEFAHVITPGSDEDFFGPLSNRGSPSIDFHETSGGQNEEEATSKTKVSSDRMSGPDPLQPNPSSILEACFSDVNYESSVTFSSNGTSLDSSVQIGQQAAPILLEGKPSLKTEMESISSSPSFVQILDEESEDIPSWCRKSNPQLREWEISYVREILTASELHYKDLMLGCDMRGLDPLIFSHLEHKRSIIPDDGNKGVARLNRKLLFDCVSERLSLISNLNLHAGFRSCFWTNAKMMAPNELAEKIYEEISTWESLGGRKEDELVEKDTSNYPRRWIDFETDLFEIRSQIEEKVLANLIDEIAVQFLD